MTIKLALLLSVLFSTTLLRSQQVSTIYKTDGLLKRIGQKDTTFVVNFWATWCKPCVEELPTFDSLPEKFKNKPLKIILVNLDFREELERKVNPFLTKHKIQSECILLDEINGNDFINKISPSWSGAIPATLFKKGNKKHLVESKLNLQNMLAELSKLD